MKTKRQRHMTIDALPLLFEGGISNYVKPLAENLLEHAGPSWSVGLLFRMGISKTRLDLYRQYRRCARLGSRSHHLTLMPDRLLAKLWEHRISLFPMRDKGENVFIATTELVPKTKGAKVGWIVYDLVQLRIPEYFNSRGDVFLNSMTSKGKRSDFIIAISECTKRDVQELLQYPEDRICVIYPGVTLSRDFSGSSEKPTLPRRPYIYYLGALALNKNVDGMLRIFSRCVHEHRVDADIILTGKDFCGRSFWQKIIYELRIEDRVHMTGWISELDRERLLTHATMLWQFSWYEGFGLPVLEAASRGVPVLCTNRGSVPEILSNPEQEIDPAYEEEAAAKAALALTTPETLERWKGFGLHRASEFSWEKSALKLLGWMEERV
jgi:glycosyltransferase involved in cell wall biosynthesis